MARSAHSRVLVQSLKVGDKKGAGWALGLSLAVLLVISCGLFSSPAQPAPTGTVTPVPSLAPTSTVAPTSTPAPPSLLASVAVPCLNGPGDAYEQVAGLQSGEEAEIVGQSEGFWVVRTAAGSVCWVPDQGVVAQGEAAAVPEVEPPPVPTPAALVAPANLEVLIVACTRDKSVKPSKFVSQFHLYWQDLSSNEDGFRVYRDGNLVAELPADKTEVIDKITTQNSRSFYYYVVAYNAVGEAKGEGVSSACVEGSGGGGYP
ncbi:MAG: hypothetical protein JW963_18835 [Anaerolineales bacterium]|nr:hypothetical protein [Anaerolineales bacterium]